MKIPKPYFVRATSEIKSHRGRPLGLVRCAGILARASAGAVPRCDSAIAILTSFNKIEIPSRPHPGAAFLHATQQRESDSGEKNAAASVVWHIDEVRW